MWIQSGSDTFLNSAAAESMTIRVLYSLDTARSSNIKFTGAYYYPGKGVCSGNPLETLSVSNPVDCQMPTNK